MKRSEIELGREYGVSLPDRYPDGISLGMTTWLHRATVLEFSPGGYVIIEREIERYPVCPAWVRQPRRPAREYTRPCDECGTPHRITELDNGPPPVPARKRERIHASRVKVLWSARDLYLNSWRLDLDLDRMSSGGN